MSLDVGVPQLTSAMRALGERLRALGYDAASQHPREMTRHWRAGVPEYDAARVADLDDEPVGVAIRTFELRHPVARSELESTFPDVDIDALLAGGILRTDGASALVAVLGIQSCDGVLALADDEYAEWDAVLRVSASTLALADLTPHRPGGRLLDLGTGGGFLALLAVRRGMRAVGVDIGDRAVDLAMLGSALNGIDDVEWRRGDWFEPVVGERFDLVVANPPFVISSRSEFLFRDSGRLPGELARELVRRAPAFLGPDGVAIVSAEWLVPPGADWSEPVAGWVADLECDAVALRFAELTPEEHAAHWLAGVPADGIVARRAEWIRNIRDHGGASVVYGTLLLRPAPGRAPRFSPVACRGAPVGCCGDWALALLAAVGAAEAVGDDLLGGCFEVADGVRIDQPFARAGGRWKAGQSRVRPRCGMPIAVDVRPGVLDVLLALEASTPLRDTIDQVARRRGHDHDELVGAVTDLLPTLLRTALVRRELAGSR